jgi:putrescine transport system substrate-binding protein
VVVPTSTYLKRQIEAGVYRPLDKALLPNWGNLDPELMENAAVYDPGNAHAAIYLWGTNGIGYNPAMVAERLGADHAPDSWAMVFDPRPRPSSRTAAFRCSTRRPRCFRWR